MLGLGVIMGHVGVILSVKDTSGTESTCTITLATTETKAAAPDLAPGGQYPS